MSYLPTIQINLLSALNPCGAAGRDSSHGCCDGRFQILPPGAARGARGCDRGHGCQSKNAIERNRVCAGPAWFESLGSDTITHQTVFGSQQFAIRLSLQSKNSHVQTAQGRGGPDGRAPRNAHGFDHGVARGGWRPRGFSLVVSQPLRRPSETSSDQQGRPGSFARSGNDGGRVDAISHAPAYLGHEDPERYQRYPVGLKAPRPRVNQNDHDVSRLPQHGAEIVPCEASRHAVSNASPQSSTHIVQSVRVREGGVTSSSMSQATRKARANGESLKVGRDASRRPTNQRPRFFSMASNLK